MPRIFIFVLAVAFAAFCEPAQTAQGVSDAALTKAAHAARLDQIDDFHKHCKDSRRIEDRLKKAIGATAKAIRWSGGHCKLINKFNPLDAGTKWCGRATIRPLGGKATTIDDVFFD
jgi:hypothetical protein